MSEDKKIAERQEKSQLFHGDRLQPQQKINIATITMIGQNWQCQRE